MKCTIGSSIMVLVGIVACGCSCAPPPGIAFIDTGPPQDAYRQDSRPQDSPLERRVIEEPPFRPCNATGRAGAHCRDGTCTTGLECSNLPAGMTIQQLFELDQGEIAGGSDYASPIEPEDPANDAPFNGLSGGVCRQVCDQAALTDACGTCATCSNLLTQAPIVGAFGGILAVLPVTDRAFGDATGICRLDCAYEPTTRGPECPDDMTCDAFTSVCVEQCTTDTECNTALGVTYEGDLVTVVDAAHPAVCNPMTGRCERTGTEGAAVGDRCESTDDCAPGVGVCIGGLCAELGCETLNCGDGGLCLGINDHSTICIAGCIVPSDCGAGQGCLALDMPIGGFNGYCLNVCENDDQCILGETCTDSLDEEGEPVNGQCEPTCTAIGERGVLAGCPESDYCRNNFTAEPAWCEPLGGFCDLDDDCGAGQLCDEMLATGVIADGHCVDPCTTDSDCDTLPKCMTDGPLLGLCRQPCVDAAGCTSAGEVCDTTLGVCVEAPPSP